MKHLFACSVLLLFLNTSNAQTDSLLYLQKYLDSLQLVITKKADSLKERTHNEIGKEYPHFSVKSIDSICSTETIKGKITFINFWFFSCAPCMAEMAELNSLFEKYNKLHNFEFISFTFENEEWITKTKERFGIKYNIYKITKDECSRLMFQNGYPTNIILDSDGIVRYVHAGGMTTKREIKIFFKKNIYPIISEHIAKQWHCRNWGLTVIFSALFYLSSFVPG